MRLYLYVTRDIVYIHIFLVTFQNGCVYRLIPSTYFFLTICEHSDNVTSPGPRLVHTIRSYPYFTDFLLMLLNLFGRFYGLKNKYFTFSQAAYFPFLTPRFVAILLSKTSYSIGQPRLAARNKECILFPLQFQLPRIILSA